MNPQVSSAPEEIIKQKVQYTLLNWQSFKGDLSYGRTLLGNKMADYMQISLF